MQLSVIIPVYNVERCLSRCLDSVLSQTLRELEVICVDDGSTDGSVAVLQEYASKDGRIKVLLREHVNAGAARNAGMVIATGEYLGFVDSDDWCEQMLFERAYAKAKAEDADVVLWRYREWDDTSGKVIRESVFRIPSGVKSPFTGAALNDAVFSMFDYAPWNRIVRRDLVRRYQLAFQQIERSNDVSFGCLALATAVRISVVDKVLYNYRIRILGNLQSENDKTPLSIVAAWTHLVAELSRRGLLERYRLGTALASMYCFTRTFNVLSERKEAYAALFNALKKLFSKDVFFSTVEPEEISNGVMANALRMIRSAAGFSEFAIRQASDVSKWMFKFYGEREQARKDLSDVQTELSEARKELSDTKEELATVRKELLGVMFELSKLQRERTGGAECIVTLNSKSYIKRPPRN